MNIADPSEKIVLVSSVRGISRRVRVPIRHRAFDRSDKMTAAANSNASSSRIRFVIRRRAAGCYLQLRDTMSVSGVVGLKS